MFRAVPLSKTAPPNVFAEFAVNAESAVMNLQKPAYCDLKCNKRCTWVIVKKAGLFTVQSPAG